MKKRIGSEFVRIGKLVDDSGLSDENKQLTMGCLKKLPALCLAFCESYESRHVDEILRLERWVLARLTEPTSSDEGRDLAKRLTTRLRTFHEQIGLPPLNAKPLAGSPTRK